MKGLMKMATKSFINVMKFNRKNADVLLKALENKNKANKTDVKFNIVRDDSMLKQIFASRKEVKNV